MDTMNQALGIDLEDFISEDNPHKYVFKNELVIYEIDSVDMEAARRIQQKPPSRINASSFFLTIQGKMNVDIDYLHYTLSENMILQLSDIHIIDKPNFTSDYKGYVVLISSDLYHAIVREVSSMRLLEFEAKLFRPMFRLTELSVTLLTDIIHRLQKYIRAADHTFQSNLIQNEVSNFLLELAEINAKDCTNAMFVSESNHKEEILQKFIRLIILHSKEEHLVSFYASKLCMTPENLSRIIKSVSGKTVNVWIANALLAESKILLRKSGISIQQIAGELHFGNQSSFGKFFKKHTGKTPMEYKRIVNSE